MQYLDGLNERQKEAVLATDGPISVLAGAGAGKTRVLTTRIYHLIRKGVPPEKILAVTFTNKAAREMRERLWKMLGEEPVQKPFIATFHGLGRELLEAYGRVIGVPRYFSIYDRDDSEKAIAKGLKQLGIETQETSPRAVLARISKAKGEGLTAEEFRERRVGFSSRITSDVWDIYDQTLKQEKALDFDDLIAKPVRLLQNHPQAREIAQKRWDYVHIDEYQDTNELQGTLANILAAVHQNLFVVGDIDQTIYTWRGATIENLLSFDRTYPNARTVILEHNYRSSKNLVDAANAVIEKNVNRKEKRSVTDNPPGERITIRVTEDAEAEARWIARSIKYLIRSGREPEDIAVLFRTNFQSRAIEEKLLGASIPYTVLGTRFYERKEVKDALAWIRLALDPSREADKIRATSFPPRGLGKVTLAKLAAGQRDALRPSDRAKVESFEKLVTELSDAFQNLTASAFVKLVIEKSGIKKTLYEEGTADDRERFQNVQELVTLASRHDSLPGRDGIAAFLAEVVLTSDQDELDRGKNRKGVSLMTVHAAKGLEFDTVFISGMEEGLFPHAGMNDEDRDEEEERRLFYVAMTRAKRLLYLSLAHIRKMYGTDYFSEPSSFLDDLDPSLTTISEGDTIEA